MSDTRSVPGRTVPASLVEQLRAVPVHAVLAELCESARDAKQLAHPEFKRLVAYLLEVADGRDRREPATQKPGDASRQVPRLRLQMDACFGVYADLHWFRLNKTANKSGQPLRGLFPRMAASLARAKEDDFADLVRALVSPAPDAALVKLLQARGGRIPGIGVEVFSRLAFAFRRDLYFPIPRAWGESSGCLDYIDGDLRKYCGLCRNLRGVCDELGLPGDVRGSLLNDLLSRDVPPPRLAEAIHKAIGPAIARFATLKPEDSYEPAREGEEPDTLPTDFAATSIRQRRGRKELRAELLRAYGDRCALSGRCPRDLLEVAYFVPFPEGDVHAASNAMLVRSDLHTLWDLNLVGLRPGTLAAAVAPSLLETPYAELSGRTLLSRLDGSVISAGAVEERWRLFVSAHPDWERAAPVRPSKRRPAADEVTVEVESKAGAGARAKA